MSTKMTILAIKVTPKAERNEIIGWEESGLKIRLKALPKKGAANEELIAFLAKELHHPKSKIVLKSGATSRHKRLCFLDLTEEELKLRVAALLK